MALRVRTTLVALASATALVSLGLVPGSMPSAGAAPVTETFSFTGGAQTFTVPAGVTEITVEVSGGAGGNGEPFTGNPECDDAFGRGALGGSAVATIEVTPGEVLQVNVGGKGTDVEQTSTDEPVGGFNGGGSGGFGDSNAYGGGGGGASDVRQGGTSLDDRVVVAGGGGGGGACVGSAGGDGGAGGGVSGSDGADTANCDGGGGGSASAGGPGGTTCGSGDDGASGVGGTGAASGEGGGGGGGGLFGGGGGSGGAGGGGGSGFGPAGVTFETGVQSGDGVVLITYEGADTTTSTVATTTAATSAAVAPRFTG